MPGKNVPFPPMEAELVRELPEGDWQYEPKWDGFRGVLENEGGEPVWQLPLEQRRGRVEKLKGFRLSPASRDVADARRWLEQLDAAGLDGVVAKRLGVPYRPGSREAVVKVKEHKSADCVVAGVRWKKDSKVIATLLLGLYDDKGHLDYVGSAAVAARNEPQIRELVEPPLDAAPDPR